MVGNTGFEPMVSCSQNRRSRPNCPNSRKDWWICIFSVITTPITTCFLTGGDVGFTRSPGMQVSRRGFRVVLLATQIHLAYGVWKSYELSRYFRPCTSLRSLRAAWLFFSTYFFGWPRHWLFLYTANVRGENYYLIGVV